MKSHKEIGHLSKRQLEPLEKVESRDSNDKLNEFKLM